MRSSIRPSSLTKKDSIDRSARAEGMAMGSGGAARAERQCYQWLNKPGEYQKIKGVRKSGQKVQSVKKPPLNPLQNNYVFLLSHLPSR